jgi:Transglycosylase SLT domain
MNGRALPDSRSAKNRAGRVRKDRSSWTRLFAGFRRCAQLGHWAWRKANAAPLAIRIIVIAAAVLAILFAANVAYQFARKPSEMFFPMSGTLNKTPAETWREYGPLFREYATATITPELLAALAQVEGAGNPMARTYWRWRLTWNPFAIYQPASSAVGMYQMTDAAFAEARRYCIRQHTVVEDGCWLTGLYNRVLPRHAIELTAVYLDHSIAAILARRRKAIANLQQKQELAAIIHLCGAASAKAFARRGFHLITGERCGEHDVATYLAQVNAMKREFLRFGGET